jgi:PIN domain nuclease of toxin-antitoxin system
MKFILDTHSFLWFLGGDNQLSAKARKIIQSNKNLKYISMATLWEIALKMSIGKLRLDVPFQALLSEIDANGFEILSIEFVHIQELLNLDFHHRDPFDRIIIAQALTENMTIITKDETFKEYSAVALLW